MDTSPSSLLAACVPLTEAGGSLQANEPSGRIQLLPLGSFAARDGRPGTLKEAQVRQWTLTSELAERILARWRERATPLVVDYEHQTFAAANNGQPAPAAGWITALEATSRGLFAVVQWTERARAYIQACEYRYISPVFRFDPKTGAVLELMGAALTNNPALDGLDAVQATTSLLEDSMNKELADLIRTKLGLAIDAPDDAVTAALNALPEGKTLPALLKEQSDAIEQFKQTPPDPSRFVPAELLASATSQITALTVQLKTFEQEQATSALDADINAALADGRLPKACEAWARDCATKTPEMLKAYLKSAQPLAALTRNQTSGTNIPHTPIATLADEERYVCGQIGLSPELFITAKGA